METKRRKLSHIRLVSVLNDELSGDLPLIDVYSVMIKEPKNISKVIIEMNEKLPVIELQHLKRMKSKEILLFPTQWLPESTAFNDNLNITLKNKVVDFLISKNITIDYFDFESLKSNSVAAIPPKTKRQYTSINKLWPCNFHRNKYTENLVENTLFSTKELESHTKFLRLALEVRKLSLSHSVNKTCGVVITDPLRNDIIVAGGYSLTSKNPILHAAMLAIDGVARTQNGGAYPEYSIDVNWDVVLKACGFYGDVKVLRRFTDNGGNCVESESKNINTLDENEYLCTNYHIYMTYEPCTMCAMALIHSRAKRVFYIYPSDNGALGTLCKIHSVKDLNHHYEVFRVLEKDFEFFQV